MPYDRPTSLLDSIDIRPSKSPVTCLDLSDVCTMKKAASETQDTQELLEMSREIIAYHKGKAGRERRRAHALGRGLTITKASGRTMVIDMVDAHRNSRANLQAYIDLARAHPDKAVQEAIFLEMVKDMITKREACVQLNLTRLLAAMRRDLNTSLDTQAEQAQVIHERDVQNTCPQNDIDDRDCQIEYLKKQSRHWRRRMSRCVL